MNLLLSHPAPRRQTPFRAHFWARQKPLYGEKSRFRHKYGYVGGNPTNRVDPSGLDPISDWRRAQPYFNGNHSQGSSYWNGDANDDAYLKVPTLPRRRRVESKTRTASRPSGNKSCDDSKGYQPNFDPGWPKSPYNAAPWPPPNPKPPNFDIPEPMQYGARVPDFWSGQLTLGTIIVGSAHLTVSPSSGVYFGLSGGFGLPGVSGGPGWRFGGTSGQALDSTLSGGGFNLGGGYLGGFNWGISLPAGSSTGQVIATSPGVSTGLGWTWRIWPW